MVIHLNNYQINNINNKYNKVKDMKQLYPLTFDINHQIDILEKII